MTGGKERERKRARAVEEPSNPITESGLVEVTMVSNLDTLSARHLMLWISPQLVTPYYRQFSNMSP